MIVTVTLNPAYDHLLFLHDIDVGQLNRTHSTLQMPGGKGVNVASSLALLGEEVVATGFLGGQGSRIFEESLRKIGVTTNFIYINKEIRTDFYVIEEEQNRQTLFVEEGSPIELRFLNNFKSNFERLLSSAQVVEIGGSLPKGVSSTFLKELIQTANKKKVKVVLNVQEHILNECLGGTKLFIVNPDLRGCESLLGKNVCEIGLRPQISQELIEKGAEIVILNSESFKYTVANKDEVWEGEIEPGEAPNKLGVRDSLLAGFIHNYLQTQNLGEALKYGLGAALSTARNKLNCPNSKNETEELLLMAKVRKVS
ncbi:MAG: PfkB family carbohydrate kinase [Candidatus Margulisiibacteriota bacterium]